MGIHRDTRTIHTITVELPTQVLEQIETMDDIEVVFTSQICRGRQPMPAKLSWGWKRFIMGWD